MDDHSLALAEERLRQDIDILLSEDEDECTNTDSSFTFSDIASSPQSWSSRHLTGEWTSTDSSSTFSELASSPESCSRGHFKERISPAEVAYWEFRNRTKVTINIQRVHRVTRAGCEKGKPFHMPYAGCGFCKKNGEGKEYYENHQLKNLQTGRITCPVLRRYVCPVCGATGDNAHTVFYCPCNKNSQESPVALGIAIKSTRRNSTKNRTNQNR